MALAGAWMATAQCVFCEEEALATGLLPMPSGRRAVRVEGGAAKAPAKKFLAAAAKDVEGEELPATWDSREHGWIGPVKNQGSVGACWAFAAYETLETQLRKAGRGDWDFSEANMVNLHGFAPGFDDGGNCEIAAAYLLRWGGAIAETNDLYETSKALWKTDSKPMNPPVHVQNFVFVPARTNSEDNAVLKRAIMEYGAVDVSMYHPGNSTSYQAEGGAFYYFDAGDANHAVAVVGWDDGYPVANFKTAPPGDGAWLVKNSHGAKTGDGGYLHVSYYDTRFARQTDGAVFVPAAEDEDYTAVYGYDALGDVLYGYDGKGTFPIAAVFKSAWNEELAAIGVFTCVYPLDYSFSIYTNLTEGATNPEKSGGVLARTQKGTLAAAGYFTIKLDEPLELAPGTVFSVVFENTESVPCYFSICTSYPEYCDFTPVEGVTFYHNRAFNAWRDTASPTDYNGNVCLKAYTRNLAAPKDAGAGENSDGSRMCQDVATENPAFFAQTSGSFGAFANIAGANSRSFWYSWLTGLNPADPADDSDFTLSIDTSNGVPRISWHPDLGDEKRNYIIYGKESLSDADWFVIGDRDAVPASGARYFKVDVAP